jgi:hypothetical protein
MIHQLGEAGIEETNLNDLPFWSMYRDLWRFRLYIIARKQIDEEMQRDSPVVRPMRIFIGFAVVLPRNVSLRR